MRSVLLAVLFVVAAPFATAADLAKPLILVAKPELRDPMFGATVLVVTPLGAGQHVGFILNRPTSATSANSSRYEAQGAGIEILRITGP